MKQNFYARRSAARCFNYLLKHIKNVFLRDKKFRRVFAVANCFLCLWFRGVANAHRAACCCGKGERLSTRLRREQAHGPIWTHTRRFDLWDFYDRLTPLPARLLTEPPERPVSPPAIMISVFRRYGGTRLILPHFLPCQSFLRLPVAEKRPLRMTFL